MLKLCMKVTDNISVYLGELKEELVLNLEKSNIKFSIPFDKINEENVKETIIQIPELNIEVSVENDIVTYIKSGCNSFNKLGDIDLGKINSISTLDNIRKNLIEMYQLEEKELFFEKINIRAMEIIAIVRDDEGQNCRIHIMSSSHGEAFVYTLRYTK